MKQFLYKTLLLTIMLGIIVAVFGYTAKASVDRTIFLPLMAQGQRAEYYNENGIVDGLITSIPLNNNTLVVLTLNGSNIVAYNYDAYGAQSSLDSWDSYGTITRIEVVGCIWVTAENSDGAIVAHKVNLPLDIGCEIK